MYANGLKLTENGNLNLNKPIAIGQHLTITLNWRPNPVGFKVKNTHLEISTLSGSNFDTKYTAP